MKIHVVKSGETLESIAQQYGVTPELIISINELPNPENLVVGQSLAIRTPDIIYTVVQGDTLAKIAKSEAKCASITSGYINVSTDKKVEKWVRVEKSKDGVWTLATEKKKASNAKAAAKGASKGGKKNNKKAA